MGRELRRKEERKNKKLVENKQVELDTTIHGITVLKLVGAIALILFVLYYSVAVFVTKEIDVSNGNDDSSSESASSSGSSISNRILASNIFDQKEESYYVYFDDFTDVDKNVSSAIDRKSDWKIYRVDTSSSLNSKYVTEESGNASVTGLDNLKVKSPTLIQISGDRVVAYYEGRSNILNFLG